MNITQTYYSDHLQGLVEILSDGRTVWINGPDSSCLGRFSRFGIDVHRSVSAQMKGESECLDCTHERPTLDGWKRFQNGMRDWHGVVVGDEHMPRFFAHSARTLTGSR